MKKLTIIALLSIGALSLIAAEKPNGQALAQKCIGCHGADFGKKALGISKVVKGMKADEIAKELEGYKTGTFGGPMKGIMRGQVASYNNADIKAVSAYIAGLK